MYIKFIMKMITLRNTKDYLKLLLFIMENLFYFINK